MTSDEANRLNRFIRNVPQPSKLRIELAGGRPPLVLTLARTNSNKFAEAAKSIRAMGDDVLLVHALDAHGESMRVHRLREEVDQGPETQKEAWPVSEHAQMAQVITASNDRAASRHEGAYRLAFDKLEAMYQGLLTLYNNEVRRCAQLEAALQKELARKEVALPAESEGLDGLINELLPAVLPKLLAAASKATNGANGAKEA
jgi:hypothetical protein